MPLSWLGQFLLRATRISGYLKENNSALVTVWAGIFTTILPAMKGNVCSTRQKLCIYGTQFSRGSFCGEEQSQEIMH